MSQFFSIYDPLGHPISLLRALPPALYIIPHRRLQGKAHVVSAGKIPLHLLHILPPHRPEGQQQVPQISPRLTSPLGRAVLLLQVVFEVVEDAAASSA